MSRRCTTHHYACKCREAQFKAALEHNSLLEFEVRELRKALEFYRDRTSIGGIARDAIEDFDQRLVQKIRK